MTQYCMDLMCEEMQCGHYVTLLWPGKLRDLSEKSKIIQHTEYELGNDLKCKNYELINSLPIPLMDGIVDPDLYMIKKDKNIYLNFFSKFHFDIFHIHTFMGLPFEFEEAAQECGVKVIYTSHDYFPICPRCNLFYRGKDCVDDHNCQDCVDCNKQGLSLCKMKLFQSDLYRLVKDNSLIQLLRKRHNKKMYIASKVSTERKLENVDKQKKYCKLRERYIQVLESLDGVHFNSNNTLKVYCDRGYSGHNAHVISISNSAIMDHKKIRNLHTPIRFGYLGPITTHKGYELFNAACKEMWDQGIRSFEAHIFVELEKRPPYIVCHKPYQYRQLPEVMDEFDVLLAPSKWEETFGFTVLEGLSYGIPVIVSNRVGAKDLIEDGRNGYIVEADSKKLKSVMEMLIQIPEKVSEMNEMIFHSVRIKNMREHCEEIEHLYREI